MSSAVPRMSGTDRRDQLLEIARERFAERGYRATTAEVARAAGVSEALVIKHFGSKEDLFRAAVAAPLVERLEAALAEAKEREQAARGATPREHLRNLREFGADWIRLVAANRGLIFSLAREANAFPDVTRQLLGILGGIVQDVVDTLSGYADSEDYACLDPKMATHAAIGALTFAALTVDDPDAFAESYFAMTFRGVLSERGRARLEAAREGGDA